VPKSGTNGATSRARDDASKVFKVGANAVQQAKAILAEAPDLAAQVEFCALSLAAAYEEMCARRQQAQRKAKDAERSAEYTKRARPGTANAGPGLRALSGRMPDQDFRLAVCPELMDRVAARPLRGKPLLDEGMALIDGVEPLRPGGVEVVGRAATWPRGEPETTDRVLNHELLHSWHIASFAARPWPSETFRRPAG
jgi:hypothetical protein